MDPNSSERASSYRTLLPCGQSTSPEHRSSLTWQRCPDPGYHEMTIMTRKCQRCSQSGTKQSCLVKLRNTNKGEISVGRADCRERHSGCIMASRSREWLDNYNLTGEKDWKPTASSAVRAITATASRSSQGGFRWQNGLRGGKVAECPFKCSCCEPKGLKCTVSQRRKKEQIVSSSCSNCRDNNLSKCEFNQRFIVDLEKYQLTGFKACEMSQYISNPSQSVHSPTAGLMPMMQGLESAMPRPEGDFTFDNNEDALQDLDDGFWNYLDQHPLSPPRERVPGEFGIPGGDSSGGVTETAAGSHQRPVWDKMRNILYDLAEDESGPSIVQESSSPKANVPECANRSDWTTMQNLLYDLEQKPTNLTRPSIHDSSIESSTSVAVPAVSPEKVNSPQKVEVDNRPVWEAMGNILRNLK